MGVATTRTTQRALAAFGIQQLPAPVFEAAQCVNYGGVLTLIPFLITQGLLSYQHHYKPFTNGYYRLESIIMTLCYIYLCRFKSIEQLKNQKPGELGKLLGLDRVPEAKCMRLNVKAISNQEKAQEWNQELTQQWLGNQDEEETLFYIDGHVYVYSGYKARLGKKHVARQKLCLAGLTEFWVHDQSHMPVMVVTGQVNEKLIEMLDQQILPRLDEHMKNTGTDQQRKEDEPRFTLIFDREGYSPALFARLWEQHRIAVITYKKFVKDEWEDQCFEKHETEQNHMNQTYEIAEKQIQNQGINLREIRVKGKHDKQTSLVTTHPKLEKVTAATYLFNRWIQENFFRYGRQDYALDKITEYTVNELDENTEVVNPEYNKISYKIKKTREKISRKKAALYEVIEKNVNTQLEKTPQLEQKQANFQADLQALKQQEEEQVNERQQIKRKIPLKEMPENKRYNTINRESKHFQNILKMICYRAETAMVNLLAPHYTKNKEEGRMLVKEIINTPADLKPDYQNNTLTVNLYGLSTPRANNVLNYLVNSLNETETTFPGTNTKLIFNYGTI